jgi:glutamine cyclotransferase
VNAHQRARARSLARPVASGTALWIVLGACGGDATRTADSTATTPPPTVPTPPAGVPTFTGAVVRRLPHDPGAWTQGLFFADGQLYETTGIEGASDIRRVSLETGAVLQRRAVPAPYFGEGSVAFDGRLYQLTWKNGRAFVYDLATFAPRDTLAYFGEGWGLTTDGESLVMSDGTARLRFVDPRTFAVRRTLDVRDGASPVSQLNELEWYKGEILANVWQSEQIARIDPKTGAIVGWIDLTGILPVSERMGREDVLNGIAWDQANDRLYVTGKYWPTLFEIRLERR